MAMHITLADVTGMLIFPVPIVPDNVEITTEYNNTDFQTTRRFLRIFGNQKNRFVEWSSFFPVNKPYIGIEQGADEDGNLIHEFIRAQQSLILPIRIVITNENRRPVLNMLSSIDKYSFHEDKTNDIQYSISLTEFTNI